MPRLRGCPQCDWERREDHVLLETTKAGETVGKEVTEGGNGGAWKQAKLHDDA
jgi:hypothetical protein